MLVVNRFVNIKHEQYGQDFERIGLADPSSCENVTIVIKHLKKARHIQYRSRRIRCLQSFWRESSKTNLPLTRTGNPIDKQITHIYL